LASDSLRAIRRWGDNVLDLRDSIKASLAGRRATALPKGRMPGYNDAASASVDPASINMEWSDRRLILAKKHIKLQQLSCDEF
jgi:hypothetical protein